MKELKGFSGIIGNPPYLGGSKISNLYGSVPANVLRATYEGGAKADLIAYFTKHGFSTLGPCGYMGIVTTNALRSGESRACGLAPLLKEQRHSSGKDLTGSRTIGRITNASTDMVWPGDAAVTVDLITIKKEVLPRKGTQSAVLNDQVVYRPISSRLNLRPDNDPVKIEENKNISQRGVNPRGPFQISMEMHRDLINNSTANNEVLKPWLSGDDINAQGVPTKFIVDVNHLELKDLDRYPTVRDYLLENVKVKRDELNPAKPEYSLLREKWWRWEFAAPTIQAWFNDHELIFAKSRHATRWIIGQIDKGPVLSEGTVAFFFDDHAMFAVLQSFLHEDWSREFGSTLGSAGHRYTNNCIDTYPFPIEPTDEALEFARKQSQDYLRLRESVCKALECTINELHGFVDDLEDGRKLVQEYRQCIIELDKAAMGLYGLPTDGYTRIHREDLGRFFPPQEINLACFDILTSLNKDNNQPSGQMVMGLKDIFSDFFNKKAKQNSEPDQTKISEEKQKSETDIHISKVRSLATGEHNANEPENNELADLTTHPTEPQAEEITKKEEQPDEEKKRFVIYGHRKPLSSTSNEVNRDQLKIGKTALVPKQSEKLFDKCKKATVNHPDKEKDAFEVVIQRLTSNRAILDGTDAAHPKKVFQADAAEFLPVVIDLEEIFPEEKWYDQPGDPYANDRGAHSLTTVEKQWIHKPLKQEGRRVNPERANDEWFYVDPNDDAEALKNQIIKLIQRGLGQSEGLDYEALERPHQYWVRKRLLDLAETNGKQWDAMLELAPRFGKTSCILGYWWLDTDAPLLIVEAYFLSALTSFEQAASKWNTGTDAKVYRLTEENAPKIKADLEDDKRVILLVSQHVGPKRTTNETEDVDVSVKEPSEAATIDYTETDSGETKQWVIDLFSVTNEYDAVVYVDEADFGSHTNQSAFITELAASHTEKMRHVLHGTGTNIERASRHGRKLVDLVRVTYSDLLEAKEGKGYLFVEDEIHSHTPGKHETKALGELRDKSEIWQDKLKNIVTPVYVKLSVSEELRGQFNEDTKLNPDWRSIYKHATKATAKRAVKDFFATLLDEKYGEEPYSLHQVFETLNQKEGIPNPFENEPFAMLVWCGGKIEHVNLMASQAKSALGNQYLFETITGEITTNRDSEPYAKSRIRKARAENKKGVIFFSSNMSSRSFSIPEVTVVMDCYDGGSIHVAHQKHSRALTPGPNKTHGYIINMAIDPNRTEQSHFEQKIMGDTIFAQGLEATDIKEQIERRIRLQPLYRWSQEDDGAPIPIQAEEIERLALDADRVVDMLMYNSEHIINEMMQSEEILNTIINIAGADSDLKSAHQSLQRLLDKNDDHEDDDDEDDDPVTQSTDDSEPEEAEEEVDSDDDDEEELNDKIRSILRNMVIIVQNIALQIREDEAEDIFTALKLIENDDELDDALKYWTGGVGAAEFSSSLKQIDERMMNSAFRIARTSDQFEWLEDYQGGEDDA